MTVPYLRPTTLSDPGKDFSSAELNAILRRTDETFGAYEFMMLFDRFLPAGTYKEIAYFIPFCIKYILKATSQTSGLPDVIDHFFSWVDENLAELERDGLFRPIVEVFQEVLGNDLSVFSLEKTDGGVYPVFMWSRVVEVVSGLNALRADVAFGDDILRGKLFDLTNYDSAAWTYYLAFAYREGLRINVQSLLSAYLHSLCKNERALDQCKVVIENYLLCRNCSGELQFWDGVFRQQEGKRYTRW